MEKERASALPPGLTREMLGQMQSNTVSNRIPGLISLDHDQNDIFTANSQPKQQVAAKQSALSKPPKPAKPAFVIDDTFVPPPAPAATAMKKPSENQEWITVKRKGCKSGSQKTEQSNKILESKKEESKSQSLTISSEKPEKPNKSTSTKTSKSGKCSSSSGVQKSDSVLSGAASEPAALTTDPAKRLRNLKKKLREIETLKEVKDKSKFEKEQHEKLAREKELIKLIADLEKLVSLNE